MARDYKGKRLRSSDEKLLKEGAYVVVPVETLENMEGLVGEGVRSLLAGELNLTLQVLEDLNGEIKGSTTNKQGGK